MPRKRKVAEPETVSTIPEPPRPLVTCVDRETLLAILRELRLDVTVRDAEDMYSNGFKVEVTLMLDDEIITDSYDTFYIPKESRSSY